MTTVIPFISQLPEIEQLAWISQLNRLLKKQQVVMANQVSEQTKKLCDVAIVAKPDADIINQYPNLIWLHSLWAGVDSLVEQLTHSKIKVVRLLDPQLADTMSEAALTWCLYLHRDMPKYLKQQANQQWLQHKVKLAQNTNIGVLGLGQLGQKCAKRLAANGFSVSGWSLSPKSLTGVQCYFGREQLPNMLKELNILLILLPLTVQTKGLVDRQLLNCLPKGASVINFARGQIINTKDLVQALNSQQLTHAVLDVFEQEPLSSANELWQQPNLTILPHISAPTNLQTASAIVANNISRYFALGLIPACVDLNKGY